MTFWTMTPSLLKVTTVLTANSVEYFCLLLNFM